MGAAESFKGCADESAVYVARFRVRSFTQEQLVRALRELSERCWMGEGLSAIERALLQEAAVRLAR